MNRYAFSILAAAAAFYTGAVQAHEDCPMNYAAFEFAIPHLDLETCPAALAQEGAFCRASTGNDALHVFVFASDGEQCLLGMRSFDEDAFTLTLK
jgi:hypothetical protein